jgi:hypothetical protein
MDKQDFIKRACEFNQKGLSNLSERADQSMIIEPSIPIKNDEATA